jgi:hypothetical protein
MKLRIRLTTRDVAIESCPDYFRGRNVVGASDRVDFIIQIIINADGP